MARIAGVNIPTNKRVEIALTYIHGIGRTRAKEITQKLSTELQKVLKQPDVVEKLRGVGVTPGTGNADELAKYAPAELEKYRKLIKDANIKAD